MVDCKKCINRGVINGISQELVCDGCIHQGRDWRKDLFKTIDEIPYPLEINFKSITEVELKDKVNYENISEAIIGTEDSMYRLQRNINAQQWEINRLTELLVNNGIDIPDELPI